MVLDHNRAFAFRITGARGIVVAAENEADRRNWMHAIQSVLDGLRGTKPLLQIEVPVPTDDDCASTEFSPVKVLGRGGFGKITLVERTDDASRFAMKTLRKDRLKRTKMRSGVELERSVMTDVAHPFLVHCHAAYQTPLKLYMIMDYLGGGDLLHWLTIEKRFSEERALQYSATVQLGLAHLHSKGLAHRDIKAENVVLCCRGFAKLVDFGLVKSHCTRMGGAKTLCGTPEYLAPEVLGGSYGTAADWWSFGLLVFVMLTGRSPFYSKDIQETYALLLEGRGRVYFPTRVSKRAKSLVWQLLEPRPDRRLQGHKVNDHDFYSTVDWQQLVDGEVKPRWVPPVGQDNVDPEFVVQDPNDSAVTRKRFVRTGLSRGRPDTRFPGFKYYPSSTKFVGTTSTTTPAPPCS
jgi:serine/threonine protein kinase